MKKKFTKIGRVTLILIAVFFFGITVSSQAADRYISPTGSDTNGNGTLASPWKTIAKASTGMAPGETVYARGGTYLGEFGRNWKSSGNSTSPVYFKRYIPASGVPEVPIFDGEWGAGSNCCDGEFMTITSLSYIVVDGMTITKYNDPYGDGSIGINDSGGSAAHHITIQNCTFKDNGTDDNEQDNDHHIYLGGSAADVIIRNNRFERCPGAAIHAYHTPTQNRVKIYNNVIIGGTSSNYSGNQRWGILIGDGRDFEIYNNTIYNTQLGIDFSYGASGSPGGTYVLKNNSITNCTVAGLKVSSAYQTYFSSDYNNIYNNSPTNIVWGSTNYTMAQFAANTAHETNGLSVNPSYVSIGSDFHLQSSSLLIGEGTSGGNIPTVDFDYNARTSPYDIGAYEYGGSSCAPSTPPTVPLHPAATPFSNSRIDVSWYDNSSIEENYLIERSLNSTINFVQVGSVGANVTTFSNTGLAANTKYYYRIRAINCKGASVYTSVVSAITTPTCGTGTAPGAPTGPSATVGSGTQGQGTYQITVAWTNGSGTRTGMVVERSTNATYGFTQVANLASTATSYVDWGLNSGTLYYYRIRSVNCAGNSGYISTSATTNACSSTNPNGTPTTPTSPTTGSVTSSSITVGWTDWTGIEAAYVIQRSTNSSSGFVEIGRVAPAVSGTLSYVDAGLSSGTTYYYRIFAWNCNGYSTQTGSPGGAGYISANATTASGSSSAPNTEPSSSTTTTTEVSEPVMSNEIIVYPNPSVTSFVLSIPSDVILKGASMKIYDRYGKEVKSVSISSNMTVIERGSLQSGIYYYHIINNNEKIYNGKLMISNE